MYYNTEQIKLGNERLMQLALVLDTADEVHVAKHEPTYDQTVIHHECGTPACALGHWACANPDRWIMKSYTCFMRGSYSPRTDAMNEFALNMSEYDELFSSYGCGRAKTAKAAADYIREFV